MSQIFSRGANALARGTLACGVAAVIGLTWGAAEMNRSSWVTRVGAPREQPVPFSHRHHVSGLGIDCRYCHTSVEKSAFAGLPATEICMSCHSQIWSDSPMLEPVRASLRDNTSIQWTRVHDLPGFVYFNHSIHIHKGVGCESCHGRVDTMPLMWQVNTLYMEWCLECHRQPEKYLRPRDQIFTMGYKPKGDQMAIGRKLMTEYHVQKLTDCYTCHR